ncbi:MAG: type I DNA topoisomerase [Saprospiraceae bacterium]|jgi:DNA topoisomerase-1
MPKNLLIVESPSKAKTIEKFLGKDFKVKSSYGHIRDLDKGISAVNIKKSFEPKYVITPDKRKLVKELKEAVSKSDEVWLATDEDREGEAISWHLCKVLDLDEFTTKRIVFREITRPAIQNAIKQPRLVDIDLVNAQQARRILDRLVGYELSELLWKKIRGKLSAGRVQSVAVKLLVEREREINDFEITSFYKVHGEFEVKDVDGKIAVLKAELPERFGHEKEAKAFLQSCMGALFKIENIEVKPLKRKPTAPFTTSTLQQEASRKLGFSVQRTMSVAQRLYEAGLITYMRTDSISLSQTAMVAIAAEIENSFGKEYLQVRNFKSKSANAQEAHEAIRPTYIENQQVTASREEQRLYDLIWKRTIASQMADAVLEKTTVKIGISTVKDRQLVASGEVLKFDGFLKVYLESKDEEEEEETKGMLPPLKIGQALQSLEMAAMERFTRPPARYSEAALVKKLEELGIGRPSTYAPTISRIMEVNRGYVVKENREGVPREFNILTLKNDIIEQTIGNEMTGAIKNHLVPTDLGMTVSDFLEEHFQEIMNYSFTAGIEKKLDDIASNGEDWVELLENFYGPFHQQVVNTIETAERPSKERILGKDPESGRTVLTRLSRRGPVIQIGSPDELEEDEKPRYASLRRGQSIETISFEEAIKLFELPKVLGTYKEEEVLVAIGRFGPYVKFGEKYVSIPRNEEPMDLTLERAQELIDEKLKEEAAVGTFQGLPITKGKGRFGPFLKWNNLFVNVPKRYDFENISQGEMTELIQAKIEKEANRYIQKWEEAEIAIENGRWGPFIRYKKSMIKIPKIGDVKPDVEQLKAFTLEEVKELIEKELPGTFSEKKSKKTAAKKKPAPKKKVSGTKKSTNIKKNK